MLPPSANKSRPIYPGLEVRPTARRHLVAANGEGALAVVKAFGPHPEAAARSVLLYCPSGSAGQGHDDALAALGPERLYVSPSQPTLLVRLASLLATATMGTRLYAAGTEGFIGSVVACGVAHGVDQASIGKEHRGSLARRVQCVHCKGMTENVTVTPVTCSHCGLSLFVRDHFSRRLGAFQGFAIDAEAPGEIPAPEAAFP